MEKGKINANRKNQGAGKAADNKGGASPSDSQSGNPESGQASSEQGGKPEQYTASDIKVITSESMGIPELKKPTDPPKQGRGRPFGSTKNKGIEGVSQKPAGKQHDKQQVEMMVKSILIIGFNITASRAGEHWQLTQKEAESIAEPVAAIMERYNLTEASGKYGEFIALIVALGMVMIPKLMIHFEIKKAKKGAMQHVENLSAGRGTSPAAVSKPDAGKIAQFDRTVSGTNTAPSQNDVKGHLASIQG